MLEEDPKKRIDFIDLREHFMKTKDIDETILAKDEQKFLKSWEKAELPKCYYEKYKKEKELYLIYFKDVSKPLESQK